MFNRKKIKELQEELEKYSNVDLEKYNKIADLEEEIKRLEEIKKEKLNDNMNQYAVFIGDATLPITVIKADYYRVENNVVNFYQRVDAVYFPDKILSSFEFKLFSRIEKINE